METEKRLVDLDVAIERAKASDNIVGSSIWETSEVVEFLEDCPIEDAVEVVHGRWVDRYGGKYANHLYECSECKKKALYKREVDVLGHEHWVQALTQSCPYCMAKMDGERKDDG